MVKLARLPGQSVMTEKGISYQVIWIPAAQAGLPDCLFSGLTNPSYPIPIPECTLLIFQNHHVNPLSCYPVGTKDVGTVQGDKSTGDTDYVDIKIRDASSI